MFQLPLFPLNSVLFPGAPITLHIFEDRYKKMMQYCLKERKPFGVILIEEGRAEHGPLAKPYTIGCMAMIQQVEPMPQGRMTLLAFGKERFRVDSFDRESKPYLIGNVESFPLIEDDVEQSAAAAAEFRPLIEEYVEILARVGDSGMESKNLPDKPIMLAYLAASLLRAADEEKQQLLEEPNIDRLFKALTRIYRRDVTLLSTIPSGGQGSFSFN